ncbi:MAG: competence/damage-inducible protein A [Verrucomicrobia subdivision 3 bacterium]|nr:competence/damage-inducible protein A [Limisphaerales bacterium]
MLGRVLNTHQQWLCRQLSDLGWVVERQVSVADTAREIRDAVREALGRADLVITTGGLGPTSDDLTRELLAEMLHRKLIVNEEVRGLIRDFFVSRGRPQPERTEVQALVPEGATVFLNHCGTAPGLAVEVPADIFRGAASWLVMLPGPPRELRPMWTEQVVPFLKRVFPEPGKFVCRTLRTSGVGESRVEEVIARQLARLVEGGLEIGYCARVGQVDVRFICRGPDAKDCVAEAEKITRRLLRDHVFGVEDEEFEAVVVRLLTERKQTLALAESCTGGLIANRITNVPGASAVLLAGVVAYSNEAKQQLLGVSAETLAAHGAVSEPVAREMAQGARKRTGADYAVSVTGIAGPSGGTPEKPVGTVYIGVATPPGTKVVHNVNAYDRETFKQVTSQQALELLRNRVLSQH